MSTSLPKLANVVILRSFAIMAVVLYHCYCPWLDAWNWINTPIRPIYSFFMEVMLVGRMPLFVFVSGYLFSHLYIDRGKYHHFIPFLNNKFKRLLIPLFLFSALMALCLNKNYINMIIGNDCYHLWFLKMLFWSFLICWVIASRIRSVFLDLLCLAISIALMFIPSPNILGLSQLSKYFVFFLGGYLFYKYRHNISFIYKRPFGISIFILYILLCGLCAIRYSENLPLAYSDIIHSDKIIVLSRYILRPIMISMFY